jgi:hypothetical protein
MNIQSDKWQVAGGKRPKAGASLAARHLPLATLILWGVVLVARADVLIGTNGDRFTGKVVAETAESVVFDAELGGRLTIPRARIREIQRPVPPITDNRSLVTNNTSAPLPLSTEPSTLNPQPTSPGSPPPSATTRRTGYNSNPASGSEAASITFSNARSNSRATNWTTFPWT